MSDAILKKAAEILRQNDNGTYTVPTHGLYPFQWNWDSCLTALGQAYYDENRAWTEIETLFDHQWPDGMVPHIVFHKEDDGYFPGPEIWQTNRPVPTSGITQPPVAGFAVSRLLKQSKNKNAAELRARQLLPKIHAWHEWFFTCRDPQGTGLVAIIHPWESGRDNSIDWDTPFDRVPTEGVIPFQRLDTTHADPDHRPTQEQYERFTWLVQLFRGLNWDNTKLHDASPFRVVDPGINGVLLRSVAEVARIARELGEDEIATVSEQRLKTGVEAMDSLWNESHGQYTCLDRVTNTLIDSPSIGGFMAAFAPLKSSSIDRLASSITALMDQVEFGVPSHPPSDPRFDGLRYWRGPVWLIVNYLISDGLFQAGKHELASRIEDDSLKLIQASGFAEYYDPITGAPCGGEQFSWTAAMVIELLNRTKDAA